MRKFRHGWCWLLVLALTLGLSAGLDASVSVSAVPTDAASRDTDDSFVGDLYGAAVPPRPVTHREGESGPTSSSRGDAALSASLPATPFPDAATSLRGSSSSLSLRPSADRLYLAHCAFLC